MNFEYCSFAAVVIVALVGFKLGTRRLNQHGHRMLLESLEVLDLEHRERVLARFTPRFQAELRGRLRQRLEQGVRNPRVRRGRPDGAQWFAFLAATKGGRIHRMLDGVLVVFLVFGMFGGGIAGLVTSGLFASVRPALWEGVFLVIGMLGAMAGFVCFRFWALGVAYRRYLAHSEAQGGV